MQSVELKNAVELVKYEFDRLGVSSFDSQRTDENGHTYTRHIRRVDVTVKHQEYPRAIELFIGGNLPDRVIVNNYIHDSQRGFIFADLFKLRQLQPETSIT